MNLKSFVSNAGIYVIGSFFVQGLTFFTLPIFSRILLPADFGLYSSYTFWVALVTIFIGLQTPASINNAYIDFGEEKLFKYVGGIACTGWGTFILMCVFTLCFKNVLSSIFEIPGYVLMLGVFQSFFVYFFNCLSTIYRIMEKPVKFLVLSISNAASDILLAIIISCKLVGDKYLGRVFSSSIVLTVVGAVSAIIIYRNGKVFFDRRYIVYGLKFSLPLIFHALAAILFTKCDQLMLIKLADASIAGIYSYGTNFGHIMYVLYSAMNQAFVPWYYSAINSHQKESVRALSRNYVFFVTCIFIGLILVLPEIIIVISDASYYEAKYTAPLIAFGFFVNFLYTFPVNFEFFNKKTKFIAIGTVASSLMNIFLNIVLIPRWGAVGAALTTVISYTCLLVLHIIIAKYVIGDYELKWTLFILYYFIGVIALVVYYITIESLLIRWIMAVSVGIVLLLFIFKIKCEGVYGFPSDER